MVNNINSSNTFKTSPVELELLHTLLEDEDATYPWNPSDEQSDDYYLQIEQQFQMEDVLNEELAMRSKTFYNKLDTLWSGLFNSEHYKHNTKSAFLSELQQTLQASFANRIPQDWLKSIAQKATEMFNSTQPIGEQLVQCVQTVLPQWDADDLFVMARPLAFAMRSGTTQNENSVIDMVGNREWTNLSEIEKAKVSMAIAYYAIDQLNSIQETLDQ
ncbi:hypothetical protein WA1_38105 [Scytonema hofmannii PCC 7110]|uniref:Uncharacterized protein n=1 Tax=Scytonema hofmannii PCC 7110 TaxID=128403 RepID=A0A139X0K1_9CYAN|nr:hypothetical protein [Scytonema hofmannii]KYC38163.1 hypothetical protein WA1_38105 [Scytonema hofmannii PCC 7110]